MSDDATVPQFDEANRAACLAYVKAFDECTGGDDCPCGVPLACGKAVNASIEAYLDKTL